MSRLLLRSTLLVLPLSTVSCEFFENTADAFDDLTNPLVGLGLVLGVEATDQIDLQALDLDAGLSFSMFLADAASADDLDNAPVEGATVVFMDETAADVGEGLYLIEQAAGPYTAGSVADVMVGEGEGAATAAVTLPPAANFGEVLGHAAGSGIDVDLSGQGFDSTIVVVVEASSGTLTYSTEPETAKEVYDLTRGNGDVGVVSIPGEAFPSANEVYVVGITGLNKADGADIDGMNSLLSSLTAGQMVFEPVSTFPDAM